MSDLFATAIPSPPPAEPVMAIVLGRGMLLWVWGRRGGGDRTVVVVEGRGV